MKSPSCFNQIWWGSALLVRVYLSGPIVHEDHRPDEFYNVVTKTLRELDAYVFAPQFLPRLQPREIYTRDVSEVRTCDVLIAEVSNPSHGVGMEVMLAAHLSKPVLMFRRRGSRELSLMMQGLPGKALFVYDHVEEVRSRLCSLDLSKLVINECPRCGSGLAEVSSDSRVCVYCGGISGHDAIEP
ncbi:MAG: nucleoside 2-deoxyribosyltransferase [Candidatus Thorarchaeota archaeon]